MSHTPGPWRWQINRKSRDVSLVGGVPQYDLTVMDFVRWGMGGAVPRFRDDVPAMNIMHRAHEREDWIAPFAGREHHASWCAALVHPDARLIAAAPDLYHELEHLVRLLEPLEHAGTLSVPGLATLNGARDALAKAKGQS